MISSISSALIKTLINKYESSVVNIDKLTYAANKKSLLEYRNNDNYSVNNNILQCNK